MHRDRDLADRVPEISVSADRVGASGVLREWRGIVDIQIGVGEAGVREAVAKGVSGGDVVGIEVAVVQVDAYFVRLLLEKNGEEKHTFSVVALRSIA